jgi:putative inorganic carbon (hco3(-)) transporter
MLLGLGLYYLGGPVPLRLAGLLLFGGLTLLRPSLHLAIVPLTLPLFYRQESILGLYFPLAEVTIWVGVGAWVLHDAWGLLRGEWRPAPVLRSLVREPTVWIALALAVIATLWLIVPPTWDLRKIAFREYRWTIMAPLLYFGLVLRWARVERDVWRIVASWLVASTLVSREGVEQFLAGETWSMEGVGRVSSVYPSATAFGIYVGRGLSLAAVLAIFLPAAWRGWRIACMLLSAVMALGLVLSFTRGAWIGVFAGLGVAALIARHHMLLAGLAAGAVMALAALATLSSAGIDRIRSMFDFSTQDNTGVARGQIWSAALRILGDNPVTGIGQDQLIYQDPSYGVPQLRFFQTSHPHNWVFDFWLRLGVPGLLWIIVALGWFFLMGTRLWNRLKGTALGALALGLVASMVDFAVHGLLDMAYFTMDLAVTFWLSVALLVLARQFGEREQAEIPTPNESRVERASAA